MRIAVVGAGGIGGLYGAALARAGHEVAFLARGEHLAALQRDGLRVQSVDFGNFYIPARASDDPRQLGQADLVLFAVKTYDLTAAAHSAATILAPGASLVTFQNGVEAPDQVAAIVGREHVLIGTTRLETTILEPGVIGHLGVTHEVTVSALDGPPTAAVEQTVDTFQAAGINAVVVADGRGALWDKASQLIPMATVTAVCRTSIGPIRDLAETRELTETLLAEVAAVATAYGHDVSGSESRAKLGLRNAPGSMKSSMARDFERGKPTELDALTGALVRLADARGLQVPATRTAYAILKLREQLEGGAAGTPQTVGFRADER